MDGLDFGGLCAILFSSRAPLVEDTAFSGLKLLSPIYIGASTISTKISTMSIEELVINSEDRMRKWKNQRERGVLVDESMAIGMAFEELEKMKWLKLPKLTQK